MGVNDAQEMLEAAQEECIRLERENADLRAQIAVGDPIRTLEAWAEALTNAAKRIREEGIDEDGFFSPAYPAFLDDRAQHFRERAALLTGHPTETSNRG